MILENQEMQIQTAKLFRIPSQWRMNLNKTRMPSNPDTDELLKIKAYIKAGQSDDFIIDYFHIPPLTLKKIKKGKYRVNENEELCKPNLTQLKEIRLAIAKGIEKDDILIEWNLSEFTYKRILKGQYKVATKKNCKDNEDE